MQALYGEKNFGFVPLSFNCPKENAQLNLHMKTMIKQKPDTAFWIMKPKASSQGKGITIIKSFEEVPRN